MRLPRTHTRRRADRCFVLATFHAGLAATPRVRRDARDGARAPPCLDRLSQAVSARKVPGYDPDRHAQASEPDLSCLPLGTQKGTHRRRRGSEGHFLGDKGFTEQEVTFASAVTTAPYRRGAKKNAARRRRCCRCGKRGLTGRVPRKRSFPCRSSWPGTGPWPAFRTARRGRSRSPGSAGPSVRPRLPATTAAPRSASASCSR